MIEIRSERPDDIPAIHRVNVEAFNGPGEAELVDALRIQATPFLSLVAVEDENIIGHIAFSPVTIEGYDSSRKPMGLAPMAVLPKHQRRGIGSQLVEHGVELCRQSGSELVVVLGHPEYYPRFGFRPARPHGLRCEYQVPDDTFMVAELRSGALTGVEGLVKYHEAFSSVA